MKQKIKNFIFNSIIVFIICFILLSVYQLREDYQYYSVYTREELQEFFSMKSTILWVLGQSLYISIYQMIISLPILALLEISKMKNILKIIIAVILTFIISFIYIITHLTISF